MYVHTHTYSTLSFWYMGVIIREKSKLEVLFHKCTYLITKSQKSFFPNVCCKHIVLYSVKLIIYLGTFISSNSASKMGIFCTISLKMVVGAALSRSEFVLLLVALC